MKYNKKILEAINRGIRLALDDYEDIKNNEPISSKHDIIRNENEIKSKIDFCNQFVDLGLPSGTLWSRYNLGVNYKKLDNATDWFGKYCYNFDKYSEEELFGDLKKKYNVSIPSLEQFQELIQYTYHDKQIIEDFNNIINLYVFKLKSRINGESIYIPCTGMAGKDGKKQTISNVGEGAYFWTCSERPLTTTLSSFSSYYFVEGDFGSNSFSPFYYGFNIRPVINR